MDHKHVIVGSDRPEHPSLQSKKTQIDPISRRTVLKAAAVGVLIAGCTGSNPDDDTNPPSDESENTTSANDGDPESTNVVEGSWPMFQANAANIGHADTTGPTDAGDELWRYQADHWVYSSPTVVDETVYLGSNDNHIYALSAQDGDEQWQFQTDQGVDSSAAVVNETVYIGSADGNVYALSADNGSEQWRFQTGDEVGSSPVVIDNTVYIGSLDQHVYALNADDGSERWRFQTDDQIDSSPAVVDGVVYIGSRDQNVYALSEDRF